MGICFYPMHEVKSLGVLGKQTRFDLQQNRSTRALQVEHAEYSLSLDSILSVHV